MAQRGQHLQRQLTALKHADPLLASGRDAIVLGLAGPPFLVAAAARRLEETEARGFAPELLGAFERMMKDAVKRDPGCHGKVAIASALLAEGHLDADVFLTGIQHRQREKRGPGPPTDTAATLRSVAALGLVAVRWPQTPVALADLLADPEPGARVGAVRALVAWWDPVFGTALVELRLNSGERDPDVIAEGLEALMELDADANLPRVERRLRSGDDVMEECAALALGSSRHRDALDPLRRWVDLRSDARTRRVGLVAIGLLRSMESVEILLGWLGRGDPEEARWALEGLAVHAHDPRVAERVRATAAAAGRDASLGPTWSS